MKSALSVLKERHSSAKKPKVNFQLPEEEDPVTHVTRDLE